MGERSYWTSDYTQALQFFQKAERLLGEGVKRITEDVVSAGIGLCSAQMGDLHEARVRASGLRNYSRWYFDPRMLGLLTAELQRAKGDLSGAAESLADMAMQISQRFRPQWVALRLEEIEIRRRLNPPVARRLAEEALSVATDLRLPRRMEQLRRLC